MGVLTNADREAIATRFPDCMECGAPFNAAGIGTGYGWTRDNRRICYACCADGDKATMIREGKHVLYLTKNRAGRWHVTNWPGSLSFPCYNSPTPFRHPFTRHAVLAYFTGPDGKTWSARNIGDNEIAHCRRIKG